MALLMRLLLMKAGAATPAFFRLTLDNRGPPKQAAQGGIRQNPSKVNPDIALMNMARPEVIKTPLGQRLRDVRLSLGDPAREDFSNFLGLSPKTLANHERGDTVPDASVLTAYREKHRVNVNWLLTGEGEMFQPEGTSVQGQPQDQQVGSLVTLDMVRLPVYDARASAGNGFVAVDQMPVGDMAFARNFLRSLGANPDYCYVLEARGDSMYPTISDGALLIGDASKTVVDDGRVYHFNVNERVLVKRARWRMDGRLHLTSDNVAAGYPDESFAADRVSDLYVGGRIMFVGQAPQPVR